MAVDTKYTIHRIIRKPQNRFIFFGLIFFCGFAHLFIYKCMCMLRGAQACVVAFSTTDRDSLLAVRKWKKKVKKNYIYETFTREIGSKSTLTAGLGDRRFVYYMCKDNSTYVYNYSFHLIIGETENKNVICTYRPCLNVYNYI